MCDRRESCDSAAESSSIIQLLNDESSGDDPLGTLLNHCFTQRPVSVVEYPKQSSYSQPASSRRKYASGKLDDGATIKGNKKVTSRGVAETTDDKSSCFLLELEEEDVKICTTLPKTERRDDAKQVPPANAGGFLLELELDTDEVQTKCKSTMECAKVGFSLELDLEAFETKPSKSEESVVWKDDSWDENLLLEAERIALRSVQSARDKTSSNISSLRPCCVVSPTRLDGAAQAVSTPNARRRESKTDDDSFTLPRARRAGAKQRFVQSQSPLQNAIGSKSAALRSQVVYDSDESDDDDIVLLGESPDSPLAQKAKNVQGSTSEDSLLDAHALPSRRLRKTKKSARSAFIWTQAVCKAVASSDEDEQLDESAIARELGSFVAQSQSQSPSLLDRSAMHAVYLRTIRDDALAMPPRLAALLDRHTAPTARHNKVSRVQESETSAEQSSSLYQYDSFCVPDDVL